MWVNVAVQLKPEHIGLKFLLSTGTTVNMVPQDNESYIVIENIEKYSTL